MIELFVCLTEHLVNIDSVVAEDYIEGKKSEMLNSVSLTDRQASHSIYQPELPGFQCHAELDSLNALLDGSFAPIESVLFSSWEW